jgi:Fusaric acid resistance protein-like
VPIWGKSLDGVAHVERSNFNLSAGLRAAAFVVAPLVFGFLTGRPELVFATLGAMFVTNTEGPNAAALPLDVLLLACLTEASAFAVGTLAGLTSLLVIPLVGLGVFIVLAAGGNQTSAQVARFTAIFFAVGVGLPGGSTGAAGERLWLALLGGLWALLGMWLHRSLTSKKTSSGSSNPLEPLSAQLKRYASAPRLNTVWLQTETFRHSIAVGAASALGLTIGLALGLPRDFWIVITIIIALRPKIGPTLSFTAMMVSGTIVGAVIAAALTVEISNVYLLEALLFAFATAMFATKGINLCLFQVFFTPFIIILLNLLYPGEWQLAEIRILDVAIGGAIAILTVYLVRVRFALQRLGEMRRP